MKFGIISHAVHKLKEKQIYSYEPYVREMNLWAKYVDEIVIVAPISNNNIENIEKAYNHSNLRIFEISNFNITSIKNIIKTLLVIPKICFSILKIMKDVDHIHIRCPGNIGLLGCFIQVLFPSKPKTVKYAGNWDPNSRQPLSYRIQKWILSNTFLTRNCKVLVYGHWKNQSQNIIPFFTASYKKNEIEVVGRKTFSSRIIFMFVGAFSKGKQPFLSVKVVENLYLKGFDVHLKMFGEGEEFLKIKEYISNNSLEKIITLYGNQPKNVVKHAYKTSHFLLFISQSEGWPKVVAEAMFWRCLPISSNVSCVNSMLDYNNRGSVLKADITINEVTSEVINYFKNENIYQEKVLNALKWSQSYTLDKFETEIKNLLKN